ncbi:MULTISPECIES: hypothetical protein [unclassified Microcoleus]
MTLTTYAQVQNLKSKAALFYKLNPSTMYVPTIALTDDREATPSIC